MCGRWTRDRWSDGKPSGKNGGEHFEGEVRESWRAAIIDARAGVHAAPKGSETSVGLLGCSHFHVTAQEVHDALDDVVNTRAVVAPQMLHRSPRRHRHKRGQRGRRREETAGLFGDIHFIVTSGRCLQTGHHCAGKAAAGVYRQRSCVHYSSYHHHILFILCLLFFFLLICGFCYLHCRHLVLRRCGDGYGFFIDSRFFHLSACHGDDGWDGEHLVIFVGNGE